ncbi:hypothetical protein R3P38DRAFT_3282441 [Favolaschia claudopus]|uniref:Uncharacterized protein n=1 Tax=Favolaschia claudopus TaxID=2862362 RepID=A0AAW0ACC1_9AGAR
MSLPPVFSWCGAVRQQVASQDRYFVLWMCPDGLYCDWVSGENLELDYFARIEKQAQLIRCRQHRSLLGNFVEEHPQGHIFLSSDTEDEPGSSWEEVQTHLNDIGPQDSGVSEALNLDALPSLYESSAATSQTSWEDIVERVGALEDVDGQIMVIYAAGGWYKDPMQVAKDRFPQKLIEFLLLHAKWAEKSF